MAEMDTINALSADYGEEWCIKAIKEAVRAKGSEVRFLPVKYLSVILRNWKKTGRKDPWEPDARSKPDAPPVVDYEEKRRHDLEVCAKRDAEVAEIVRKQILGEQT